MKTVKKIKAFFKSKPGMITALILFWPLGLFLIWRYSNWRLAGKLVATGYAALITIMGIVAVINAPPSITIASSLEATENDTYLLEGQAFPRSAVVTVNGVEAERDGADYKAEVKLQEGDNKIVIVAIGGDKRSEKEIAIYRYTAEEITQRKAEEARHKAEEDRKAREAAEREAERKRQEKEAQKEKIYTLTAKAGGKDQQTLRVEGTTNLPDGAVLSIGVSRVALWGSETYERFTAVAETTVTVSSGKFLKDVSVNDKRFLDFAKAFHQADSKDVVRVLNSNVEITVEFGVKKNTQPNLVIEAVGSNGEKLASSPQKYVFGSATANPENRMRIEFRTPFAFPYKSQLPN